LPAARAVDRETLEAVTVSVFDHALKVTHKVLSVPVDVSGIPEQIMMIDKSVGVEIEVTPKSQVPTLVPAAVVRRAALEAYGMTPATMVNRMIVMNGVTWIVTSARPRPTPDGEARGEYYLLLRKA
jgi:hypothetical protein